MMREYKKRDLWKGNFLFFSPVAKSELRVWKFDKKATG